MKDNGRCKIIRLERYEIWSIGLINSTTTLQLFYKTILRSIHEPIFINKIINPRQCFGHGLYTAESLRTINDFR